MVRVRRVVVVGDVAVGAGGPQARKLAVDVAGRATHRDVEPGQREVGLRVIKLRTEPLRGGMTDGAVGRETRRLVVRVRGVVVVGDVAVGAGGPRARELPVDVALLAGDVDGEPSL